MPVAISTTTVIASKIPVCNIHNFIERLVYIKKKNNINIKYNSTGYQM